MAITDWPEDQRPRERLIKHGPQKLSDAELLAVFLRIGVTGKSAVDLGREMIGHFGSLNGLFSARIKEFSAIMASGRLNLHSCKRFWNWLGARWPNNWKPASR